MYKKDIFKVVKELGFDIKHVVLKEKETEVYIFRPSVLSKRFKGYDVAKNFQIWLKEHNREFRPNHLRVMIDLNLRARSRPDCKEKLLLAFDNIYYGKDPDKELEILEKEKFGHFLNDIKVIGYLAQLFHIEQEYCYHKVSKFDPPNLFLQGWIREFIDSPKEIDNMCMSVCNGQPPNSKYVKLENRKEKKYQENLKPLWYMQKNLETKKP